MVYTILQINKYLEDARITLQTSYNAHYGIPNRTKATEKIMCWRLRLITIEPKVVHCAENKY